MFKISLQCYRCKHFSTDAVLARTEMECAAFKLIPRQIMDGEVDHRQPFPGDGGIRWEPGSVGVKHPGEEKR